MIEFQNFRYMAQKTISYLKSRFLSLMLPDQADYVDIIDSKQQTISQVVGGSLTQNQDGSCKLEISGGGIVFTVTSLTESAMKDQLDTQLDGFTTLYTALVSGSDAPKASIIARAAPVNTSFTLTGMSYETDTDSVVRFTFSGQYFETLVDGCGAGTIDILANLSGSAITSIQSVSWGSMADSSLYTGTFSVIDNRQPFSGLYSSDTKVSTVLNMAGSYLDTLGYGHFMRIIRDDDYHMTNFCLLWEDGSATYLGFVIQVGESDNNVRFYTPSMLDYSGSIPTNPTDSELLTVLNAAVASGSTVTMDNLNDLCKAGYQVPVGSVQAFAGLTLPSGWLWCDGQLYGRSGYPALYAAIGTNYGTTTSTNFRVPDLRGQFIRGWVRDGSTSAPDYGRDFGTTQKDAIQKFGGYMNDACMSYSNFGGIFKYKNSQYGNGGGAGGDSVYRNSVEIDLAQDGVRTATETRPTNVAMNYIIRADYF